ncbi:serine/threonine-protein kinase tel1 [Aspergillus campestris IBT 28561]|uniref:Serine/threonine-protein kinase Tel1 n=1 Tax=Aspergillus campestris (strain IBT 28561) TaxID=1392248 RepID=A0A2I1D108_ASPC2|nr:serine/threonine-protein kinase tel1 [Aspergillus campestris IBT 28561]PKY03552.1 serine/threonine-protein kinase tel1 [Aspergillus campestris IBT 28561]
MGEITLDRALSLLSSEKQKERTDGLADLKHILQQNRQSSKLTSLNDKACHRLFESIFRFVSAEKALFNRASSKAAPRLSTGASVLRTAVDVLLLNLRTKSIRAIVDHIAELLLAPRNGLWELLSLDYTKCLSNLLQHRPHVEHLGTGEWEKLMDFCLRVIHGEDDDGSQSSTRRDRLSTLDEYLGTPSASPAQSRRTPALTVREKTHGDRRASGEAVVCIQSLLANPCAPIKDSANRILGGLAEFVESSTIAGNEHQAAFNCINTIIMRILFGQSEFSRTFLMDMVPIIRQMWTTKLPALKDELLVTTMLCVIILTDATRKEPSESLGRLIKGLLNTLLLEYTRRSEKDTLQIDDLIFCRQMTVHKDRLPMHPRMENPKSEHNWTLLWAMANLLELSEDLSAKLSHPRIPDEVSRKKQRITSTMDDIIRDSTTSSGGRRVCALQLIPFLTRHFSDTDTIESHLQRLVPCILDDNAAVSSWTMVAITSYACSPEARSPSLKTCWQQVWDLTSRASTTQSTSRAACNLMNYILRNSLLEYSVIAETTSSMLSSVNLNSPSTMSDSSLGLWVTISQMTAQMNPAFISNASKQICAWLREVWVIGTMTDRMQTAQLATFARPLNLLGLLLACTNRSFDLPSSAFDGPVGLISRGWHFCHRNKQLINYIFDVGGAVDHIDLWDSTETFSLGPYTRQEPNDNVILDLLQVKTDLFLQTWQSVTEGKSHHVTVDIVQILASSCMVIALYTESLPQKSTPRVEGLQQKIQQLWESICSFISSREPEYVQACLMLFSSLLGPECLVSDSQSTIPKALCRLLPPFTSVLENQRQNQKDCFSRQGEVMDLDDPLSTSGDPLAETKSIINMNREAVPLFYEFATFQRCMTIRFSVFLNIHASTESSNEDLVDYLIDLDEADLLSAWDFLPRVYQVCSGMDYPLLLRLLEDLGEKCLQSYETERCETSHLLCIRMMHCFVKSWTSGKDTHLRDSASDLYSWFTDVLLAKGRASSPVLTAFAELLASILSFDPHYTSGQSSPSPRTSLFTILQDGDIPVKFSAGHIVPQLFNRFPLTDHDAILDDVLESLPRDTDWIEGIALRLFILAQLASRWHTLLRRSIYHMFETPARAPGSLLYAERCLYDVAKALGLQNAKELFRLFYSQVLYTWSETQSITELPYSTFGYSSIEDMLSDVQDEIVGQIMMRAQDEEATEISRYMGKPFVELLADSFYKAEAYSIAWDISTPPGQGSQPRGVENRLKVQLGTDRFLELIDQNFPRMIAAFFVSIDQHEQIEKAFSKRSNFQGALSVMKNVMNKSSSKAVLPVNQQPSFRARYLVDELEFLCRRSGYELETIWTPALASYVCRILLESIHPALGSLHACSVIRKIRILVCMAGSVMLSDYPFEVVIHAIRPYLTDVHCSEDALGILWYLLETGRPYLWENPDSMAGIAVSTLVSLKAFATSSPAEPMQEIQWDAICSKIQSFLLWFEDYLNDYNPPDMSTEVGDTFRRMVQFSQRLHSEDQIPSDSCERHLLLELLTDRISKKSLLSSPIADHVISLLCSDSKGALGFRHDRIGEDEGTVSKAIAAYQTLQKFESGNEYRLWAARAMGRAFAITGEISDDLLREQEPALFTQPSLTAADILHNSKASILQVLCDMLQRSSNLEVGLVERTLQSIVSNLGRFPEHESCGEVIPGLLIKALTWSPYQCPSITTSTVQQRKQEVAVGWDPSIPHPQWARNIGLFLSKAAQQDPVIGPLDRLLDTVPEFAVHAMPYILHDVLLSDLQGDVNIREIISEIFKQGLREVNDRTIPHARLVINCILYLRNQPRPGEATIRERDEWLDIDFAEASAAANRCRLPKTALLFLEIQASRAITESRRSSVARYEAPPDMLHGIFKNIDDPDLFYGVEHNSSLSSVMERLEHESSGFKNLLFQSAQYDSDIQMSGSANAHGVLKALNSTNLQGLASSVFSAPGGTQDTSSGFENMLQAATSLRKWDIPVSSLDPSSSATVFRAFQNLNTSGTLSEVSASVDECLLSTLGLLTSSSRSAMTLRTAMRVLGVMTEINDVLSARSAQEVYAEWEKISARNSWLKTASENEVGEILNCQEALFSSIKQKAYLKSSIDIGDRDAQLLEVKVIRQSLAVTRSHGIPQASLKSAVCLSKLSQQCMLQDINVEGAVKFDLANVLWDQGEMTASIQMLQQLKNQNDLHKQAIPISRAELLVTLGTHVAEARLEKPEYIIQEYLSSAVKELKNRASGGEEAGRVYHGFAMFCDQQLQNPDGLEDFKRVEQLRNRKEKEIQALEDMMKNAEGKEREVLKFHRIKTKQWFDLDDREYQRLRRSREAFLQQCLENYLLCLQESEAHNNDTLRFLAIWLDNSDNEIANAAVSKYIDQVPSRKFAPLMSQLTSRLLDVSDDFQKMLSTLIFRICVEHPFHGMYQIFASSKSKGGKDHSALSRNRAAGKLVEYLKNDKRIGPTWVAVHNSNINYVRFAIDRPDEKMKSGARLALRKLGTGQRLEQDAATQRLPPPTMNIDIRADCDYSDVPKLVRYHPEFTVASGVSAPKIVTAVASNGIRYKQLFKGGNDDLRQDAIMEQVFEQVSSLLKDHQATRQRNLGIRTYKVLPLTSNAGIIEFVPHTIPLHDYLIPAHQKYFPKDMKPNACRKHIADVQTRSFEQRVRTYRQVTEHFHPVMKYFFMEKFNNPDDWFGKRLSYTRSTAAISILGHVLGLGDRHGHNILLDERTGEVVHIDLGVAFEQGRVLPVPEVVPFRLTRDLVDGMGITRTEGVFRRCCEFTLEALRQESYSIMTILDVLRYDPLYSWTVSPLRIKKMQDAQAAGDGPPVLPGAVDQRSANEPSEADRALTVVAKKLSKTLSVTATVNELIQQATDEKNLAVLYCGWAAYA